MHDIWNGIYSNNKHSNNEMYKGKKKAKLKLQ
jgi:hypothetical protein